MAGYLFSHFIGEQKDGEQIYFSLSKDGLHWQDVKDGAVILKSEIGTKGVRDPFLVRNPETGVIYLIATDLRIEAGKGWAVAQYEGSRDLIVWESTDLVSWSGPRACTVGIPEAGCVWAPEAVYDKEKRAFFVFFASMVDNKQKIYACYTRDFKEYTEPFCYVERENHVIDTTIVETDGWYYRISKDETTKKLILERSKSINGKFALLPSETLDNLYGVEGPECYLLPDGKTWCLIADRFAEGKGYLPMLTKDFSSGKFEILKEDQYDFGKNKKRHGGVLLISDEEYQKILQS